MIPTFKSTKNGELAMKVIGYLLSRSCVCALREYDDGVITITYALDTEVTEVAWPPIRIDGSIVFPAGSDMELVMQFMEA